MLRLLSTLEMEAVTGEISFELRPETARLRDFSMKESGVEDEGNVFGGRLASLDFGELSGFTEEDIVRLLHEVGVVAVFLSALVAEKKRVRQTDRYVAFVRTAVRAVDRTKFNSVAIELGSGRAERTTVGQGIVQWMF
jgi:hypothetical protein